nr:alpha/beta hydrolase-fold protein [Gilvimarinus xylanilyticus]
MCIKAFRAPRRRRLGAVLATGLLAILGLTSSQIGAQPSQRIEKDSVFVTGSRHYHTHQFTLPGPAGHASYQVSIAWPQGDIPADGFAAVYALDGTAVAGQLTEPLLAQLRAAGGPAIIALGHDVNKRFASLERTYDYTPPNAQGEPLDDPMGRAGGRAPEYYRLLVEDIIPRVENIAPLNPQQRTLWGHSYGGLFALWSTFLGDGSFNRIVAVSPALWWNNGEFLHQLNTQLNLGEKPELRLDIHSGSAERKGDDTPTKRHDNPAINNMIRMRNQLPADALENFSRVLRGAGVVGDDAVFDGLSHGATFSRSFELTVKNL